MIGWEYCLEPEMGAWNPFERNHHHTRRRRWVRIRTRILDASIVAKKKVEREREGGRREGTCALHIVRERGASEGKSAHVHGLCSSKTQFLKFFPQKFFPRQ